MIKLLLADFDGVLNGHEKHRNGYCGIDPQKAGLLDFVVGETGCKIILATAWRYLILNGGMTLDGFRNMLLTHGVPKRTTDAILHYLPEDRDPKDPHDRGKLAAWWLARYFLVGPRNVAAVDDLDCGYRECGVPFVQTDGAKGIRPHDAYELVKILNRPETLPCPPT